MYPRLTVACLNHNPLCHVCDFASVNIWLVKPDSVFFLQPNLDGTDLVFSGEKHSPPKEVGDMLRLMPLKYERSIKNLIEPLWLVNLKIFCILSFRNNNKTMESVL